MDAANPMEAQRRQQALQILLQAVQQQPWAHDFFALLRRIDALRPEAPRTGAAQRPRQELLRFSQPPELDFAPAPLTGLQPRDGAPPRLSVRFFGLLGPQGPLPLHITEYVRDRQHQHGDANPAHFLDIFHHRLLGLFYRAWAQGQPVVQGDRPRDDRFLAWLGAAAGLGLDRGGGLPAAGPLPAPALAFHAGLLAGRSRHPEALCKVLRHQFGVPVALEPHVGQWLQLAREDRSRLGFAGNRVERCQQPPARLGTDANAGSRAWDRQYRFRLGLGPLTLAQYNAFVPGGADWQPLKSWVGRLAGPALRWELALWLAPEARPEPRLARRKVPGQPPGTDAGLLQGKTEDASPGSHPGTRLGISTWLGRRAALPAAPSRRLQLRPDTSFLQQHPTGA